MYQLYEGDCLELLHQIPDQSIDFIFADLPYGTTQNAFDVRIPLNDHIEIEGRKYGREDYLLWAYRHGIAYKEALAKFRKEAVPGLWSHYKRIIKDHGCIALFAQSPFDMELMKSNEPWYRYEWILHKTHSTGFLNANKAPLKAHEKLLIFYKKPPKYHPQKTSGHDPTHTYMKRAGGENYKQVGQLPGGGSTERYPTDVLTFRWDKQHSAEHTHQKPVAMCEYFIRTYTDEGDTVLDNTMGSGSAGVACLQTGRNFIGMEKDPVNFATATERIDHYHKEVRENERCKELVGNPTYQQCRIDGV